MLVPVSVPLPWPAGKGLRRVVPWLYYGTGWQRLDTCWMSRPVVEYWYARNSKHKASPEAAITLGTVYFFPPLYSPAQVATIVGSDLQLSLLQ